LKEGCKRVLIEPQNPKVGMIGQRMLNETNTRKFFRIQPINICMRVLCIAGTPIDITIIHVPEIGHDIDVMFTNVPGYVLINNSWVKD